MIYHLPGHDSQVSVVSGGGSGHEPSFTTFVGEALLSPAIAGSIFTMLGAELIRKSLFFGVGRDVPNFRIAGEKTTATVIILETIWKLATYVWKGMTKDSSQANCRSPSCEENELTVSLAHSHVLGQAVIDPDPGVALGHEEVETGMGIHKKPGSDRVKADLTDIVKSSLLQLLRNAEQCNTLSVANQLKCIFWSIIMDGTILLEFLEGLAEVNSNAGSFKKRNM
ncbi:DAK1/dihydroxyacetone kinase [Golovinomyces cichoracearum]|uniref:DAK1/dihydroxyacetone kinase n=1 Tax=Golovinomyces cichoracearum TaxID=62708 RepID=A0A420J0S6_9PEZI|nr:DAK1/dihydroxyacetone kinase [Golovinomyces cichoracearum]